MGILSKGVGVLADWIEAGYPEEVAKRIVSGELPMDEASRMARASEQGFDLYSPALMPRGQLEYHPPAPGQDPFTPLGPSLDPNNGGQWWLDDYAKVEQVDEINASHGRPTNDYMNDDRFFHNTGKQSEPREPGRGLLESISGNANNPGEQIRSSYAAFDPKYVGPNTLGNATVPALGVLATGTGAALAAPALKSEGLEKATGFLDATIQSARDAAGPLSFLVPYEGISNFAKKWNADEELTWKDYLGLLDY